jgi:ribosomal protein S18 acetylase RimI-like enzyme
MDTSKLTWEHAPSGSVLTDASGVVRGYVRPYEVHPSLWMGTAILGPGIAEIRHLWVAPEARGLGLGRKLLARLEVDAVNHAINTVRLGTHPLLTEALALYRSSGYTNIGGYSDIPYNQLAFE